jgi:hypothetical protein
MVDRAVAQQESAAVAPGLWLLQKSADARDEAVPILIRRCGKIQHIALHGSQRCGGDLLEHVLGREHPDTLRSVNSLAVLLANKGDYDGAEPLLRCALGAQERVLGREHPDTLRSVNSLALLLDNKGDCDGAEPLYRRAAESARKILGPDHPNTKLFAQNHARCLAAMRAEPTP